MQRILACVRNHFKVAFFSKPLDQAWVRLQHCLASPPCAAARGDVLECAAIQEVSVVSHGIEAQTSDRLKAKLERIVSIGVHSASLAVTVARFSRERA